MDIIKQLKKADIEVVHDDGYFVFGLPDGKQKRIKKREIEKYLFICLLEYIEDDET